MTKRKDGRWQQELSTTVDGRKKRIFFYGDTKSQVLKKIAEYRESAANGLTFDAVADIWWEQTEPAIAPNSRKNYKPAYKRAREGFKGAFINQIKPVDISRFLQNFVRTQKPADKTARTQLMVINLICKYAVENGYLESNPARDVSVPKGLAKEKRSVPSSDEFEKIKNSYDRSFGDFAYWLLYTGCRRGELLALTWEDVDFENRTISVNKSVYQINNKPDVKKPKTASGIRTLPLMNRLLEKLPADVTQRKGIIFPDPVSGGWMTEDHYQDLWAKYQKESGVSCTAHQIRHGYATMLFEAGVDPKDAQDLLGHAQLSTTMDIYTDIRESRRMEVRSKLLSVDIT